MHFILPGGHLGKVLFKTFLLVSTFCLLAACENAQDASSPAAGQSSSSAPNPSPTPQPTPTPTPLPSPVPTSRTILEPYYVTDPSSMFYVDHVNKPLDRFYMNARYQRPNPFDSSSTPIQYRSSYNTIASTGLGPLTEAFQRGPLGGNQAQSIFQLKGFEGGMLMRSWDSPHPSKLPICQPDCSGYQKHTVYEYVWSAPPPIFSSANSSHSLEIEGDFQIPQFDTWSTLDNGAARGLIAGQYVMVIFLKDPQGKTIQYVVFLFDSNTTQNGEESLQLEILGAGNNGYFVNTSFKKNKMNEKFVTTVPGSGDFTHSKWSGFRHYKIRITPQNIANVVQELNARGGSLSTNVYAYKISGVAINQEVFYLDNGDAWVMGSSFRQFRVNEAFQ